MRDLHRTDPKQVELQNEPYDERMKALRWYWFSLDFKKDGGRKRWSVICYLRNVQDLLADGQTPCERRFNSPCEGPIIPLGAGTQESFLEDLWDTP